MPWSGIVPFERRWSPSLTRARAALGGLLMQGIVLTLALALGCAAISSPRGSGPRPRPGAGGAADALAAQGGAAGPVEIGRAGTVLQPPDVPTTPLPSRAPQLPLVPGPVAPALGPAAGARSPYANPFPIGQCTWWAYEMKPVPWIANAVDWLDQAQRHGWLVGPIPQPGSIMVTAQGEYGHVAYVQSVSRDGSWVVSEMNYLQPGGIDQRTIRPGSTPLLLGFIYGPPPAAAPPITVEPPPVMAPAAPLRTAPSRSGREAAARPPPPGGPAAAHVILEPRLRPLLLHSAMLLVALIALGLMVRDEYRWHRSLRA